MAEYLRDQFREELKGTPAMSLSKYAARASAVGDELVEMLEEEEYSVYLEALTVDAYKKLEGFLRTNSDYIQSVVSDPPSKRHARLSKLEPEQRFWAIAAAAKTSYAAAELLDFADLHFHPGPGYREMVAIAKQALDAPYRRREYLWPFPCEIPET